MAKDPLQEKTFLIVSKGVCKELNCDLLDLSEALIMQQVKKAISDQIHFNRYLCSPFRCKACKRNIPHDDPIFDHESIYE